MRAALNAALAAWIRRANGLSSPESVAALAVCAAFFAAVLAAPFSILPARAQAPAPQPPKRQKPATPQPAPAAPAAPTAPALASGAPDAAPAQPPAASDTAPTLSTPPLAIVPLDKSIPGAALSVAGPPQRCWNGRASSGSEPNGNGHVLFLPVLTWLVSVLLLVRQSALAPSIRSYAVTSSGFGTLLIVFRMRETIW